MKHTDPRTLRDPSGPSPAAPSRRRFAAIVDLENIAIFDGRAASPSEMRALLGAVAPHVAGVPVRAATGSIVFRRFIRELADCGWGISLVPTEPDAADAELCAAAHEFIGAGATDLVVVGGDHAYVPIAARARLHVVTHAGHLARSLRLAATTVAYLPALRSPARAAS